MMALKPVRSNSHRKEDLSKRKFEEIIEPFFVPSGWVQKDYGIDAVVEITSDAFSNNDVEIESKCFLVQLKSTEVMKITSESISYSVPVKKIYHWIGYNIPVLFVVYDIMTDNFYFEWIDTNLVAKLDSSNPHWPEQDSVTLSISTANILCKDALTKIREHVYSSKIITRRTLEFGTYFQLKDRAQTFIKDYKTLAKDFDFQSVLSTIEQFEKSLELSIYRVALTGLSRVGKSSLINALIKKEISPTGFYQTTGVPIQVIPGMVPKIVIYFQDKKNEEFKFKLETIAQFGSQDHNEDNIKKVKLISIEIPNKYLESGISIFDIPGLDDPNDDILDYTWQTVKKANAVIYVIDASPAKNGGFIFKNEFKKHLTTFSQSQDKVFLVFNKVDTLNVKLLKSLKERVTKDLAKHGLTEKIGDKIFYISTSASKVNSEANSIEELNNSLWNFILKENKYGIIKLKSLTEEISESASSFSQILQSRLIGNEQRLILERSISEIKDRIPTLSKQFYSQYDNIESSILKSIELRKNRILLDLEAGLKSINVKQSLPDSKKIKKYLIDSINNSLEQTNKEYFSQINELKLYVDSWLHENLKHVAEVLNGDDKSRLIDLSEVNTYESPEIDISSAWGMGLIGTLAGLIIVPQWAIITGLVGFFGNFFTTIETRRARQIVKIVDTSRTRCDNVYKKVEEAYKEMLESHSSLIIEYIENKLTLFFNDIDSQIQLLDVKISKADQKRYNDKIQELHDFKTNLLDFNAELRSYFF